MPHYLKRGFGKVPDGSLECGRVVSELPEKLITPGTE
jgi:hypothetical protein